MSAEDCVCEGWTEHDIDCPRQFFKEVQGNDMNPEKHYIMKDVKTGEEILLIGGTKNDDGAPGWINVENNYCVPHIEFYSKKIVVDTYSSESLALHWSYFQIPQEPPTYLSNWSKHQVPPLPQTTSEIPRFIKSALRSAPDDETKMWNAELKWFFPGRCPILRYRVSRTAKDGKIHEESAFPLRWREYCFFDPESYIVTMW